MRVKFRIWKLTTLKAASASLAASAAASAFSVVADLAGGLKESVLGSMTSVQCFEVSDISAAAKEHCLLGLMGTDTATLSHKWARMHPPSPGRPWSGSAGQQEQEGAQQQRAQQEGVLQQREQQAA